MNASDFLEILAYFSFFQTYCVVTSVGEPCNEVVHIQGEGEKETEVIEKSKDSKLNGSSFLYNA